MLTDLGLCAWLLCGLMALWRAPLVLLVAGPEALARQGGEGPFGTWPIQVLFFGPVLLWLRVWRSPLLEKLAAGTALVSLVAYNVYAHGWRAESWPEPSWWTYATFAGVLWVLLLETLSPFIVCSRLWRSGQPVEQNLRRVRGASVLVPTLFLGGCLLLGALAPVAWRHWMDVPLAALLALPRCLAAERKRLREGMPLALFGWSNVFLDAWNRS
jgi:hypothetical protein